MSVEEGSTHFEDQNPDEISRRGKFEISRWDGNVKELVKDRNFIRFLTGDRCYELANHQWYREWLDENKPGEEDFIKPSEEAINRKEREVQFLQKLASGETLSAVVGNQTDAELWFPGAVDDTVKLLEVYKDDDTQDERKKRIQAAKGSASTEEEGLNFRLALRKEELRAKDGDSMIESHNEVLDRMRTLAMERIAKMKE